MSKKKKSHDKSNQATYKLYLPWCNTETFKMSNIRPLKVVECVLQQDIIKYNNLLYNLQVIFVSLFPHLPYNWQLKMRKTALYTYVLVHFGNTTTFFLNLDTVPKYSRKIQRNLPKHDKLNETEYYYWSLNAGYFSRFTLLPLRFAQVHIFFLSLE